MGLVLSPRSLSRSVIVKRLTERRSVFNRWLRRSVFNRWSFDSREIRPRRVTETDFRRPFSHSCKVYGIEKRECYFVIVQNTQTTRVQLRCSNSNPDTTEKSPTYRTTRGLYLSIVRSLILEHLKLANPF